MAQNPSLKAPVLMEKIRQQSDNILNLYFQLKSERTQQLAQNWGNEFPQGDNAEDEIPDGTPMPPINYNAGAAMSVVDEFITFMETNNRLALLLAGKKVG